MPKKEVHYIVGVFDDLKLAFDKTKEWMGENGVKYSCTISNTNLNTLSENMSERSYIESGLLFHFGYTFEKFKSEWDQESVE